MLILSDADGHGLYLHKLGKRVLKPARNGHCRAEVNVIVGKLLGGKLRRGVDGRARLVDDGIALAAVQLVEHLDGHLLRLAGGGAVADGNVLHTVFFDKRGEDAYRLRLLSCREGGVDNGGVEHLAGRVHDGDLAAVAVARVKPHRDLAPDRRLHQKRLEIQGEVFDRALAGGVGEGCSRLAFHGRADEPVKRVVRRGADKGHCAAAGDDHGAAKLSQGKLTVKLDADAKKALLLAAVYGKYLMPLNFGDRLGKVVIQTVDGVFLPRRLRADGGTGKDILAQVFSDVRIVGDHLGNDVGRAGERILDGVYALFLVDVPKGKLFRFRQVAPLREKLKRKRLKPFLLCHCRPRAALLLIRAVEVLKHGERFSGVYRVCQLLRQLPLLLNGFLDDVAPLLKIAQVLKPLGKCSQSCIVHRAVQLLAVAGDKGDGVSLVKKIDYVINMFRRAFKLAGEDLTDGFQSFYNSPYYNLLYYFITRPPLLQVKRNAGALLNNSSRKMVFRLEAYTVLSFFVSLFYRVQFDIGTYAEVCNAEPPILIHREYVPLNHA